MFPLFPFAAGLAAGVFGIRLLKGAKAVDYRDVNAAARQRFDRARDNVRQAAVAGLSAVEQSSATLRAKLTPEPAAPAAPSAKVQPKRSGARRKGAAKTTAPESSDTPS